MSAIGDETFCTIAATTTRPSRTHRPAPIGRRQRVIALPDFVKGNMMRAAGVPFVTPSRAPDGTPANRFRRVGSGLSFLRRGIPPRTTEGGNQGYSLDHRSRSVWHAPSQLRPRSRVSGALLYVMLVQVSCPTAMALLIIRPRFIEPRAKAISARSRGSGPSHLIVHQHLAGRHACWKAGDVFDHTSTPLQHTCGEKRRYSALEISTLAFSQSLIVSV